MLLFVASASFAQTKFSVDLITPLNNSSYAPGVQFDEQFVVTVQGTVGIVPGDTLAYINPVTPANQVFIRTNLTKNVGDTIQINTMGVSFINVPATNPAQYCVRAFLFNAGGISTGHDTTDWTDCHTLTVTTFPTSVDEVAFNESNVSNKLLMSPNPSYTDNIRFNYVSQNGDDVDVTVYDMSGRAVISETFGQSVKGQENYQLEVSSLQSGMYVVEILQGRYKATGQLIRE